MLANMMRVLRYVFVIHACEGDDAVTRCDRRNSSVVRRDVRACGADVVVWTSSRACEWRATSRARGIGTVDDGTIAHVCTTGI